jgi:hypothetical protein
VELHCLKVESVFNQLLFIGISPKSEIMGKVLPDMLSVKFKESGIEIPLIFTKSIKNSLLLFGLDYS